MPKGARLRALLAVFIGSETPSRAASPTHGRRTTRCAAHPTTRLEQPSFRAWGRSLSPPGASDRPTLYGVLTKRSWRVVELRLSSGHMNLPRWTAIITHHTAGLDKLGSLNSEGSGALLRWAAPEQRCCTGTPSKIHPSTHAMKLTAWARLVAPATRAGRSTTSRS